MQATHRIRRCSGNKSAWLLVALDCAGRELDSYGSHTTALSLDALLAKAPAGATVVYEPEAAQ